MIPGIGTTRRQRLLKHFGSVRAVRQATTDELAKAPGMNRKAAEQVAQYFADREREDAQAAAEFEAMPAQEISDETSDELTSPSIEADDDANVEGRAGDVDIDAEVDEPESAPT